MAPRGFLSTRSVATRVRQPLVAAAALLAVLGGAPVGGSILGARSRCAMAAAAPRQEAPLVYVCPMHPDVTASTPGTCGKCGMALVAGDPDEPREYGLAWDLDPPAPRAGQPLRLRLRVTEPLTRQPVTAFQIVHDRPYHLFVISRTLQHFFHLHPEPQPDGTLLVEVTLPAPGAYSVYSDFLPVGGTPQVIGRLLVTADDPGSLAAEAPRLVADAVLVRTVDTTTATLALKPDPLVAGREARLRYHLQDARTGDAVTNLEPYLGAWGHTLILSDDGLEYVHAHPVEYLPEDRQDVRGGPELTFNAFFPRAGLYRVWTQFRRAGVVSTLSFTLQVTAQPVGVPSR